MSTTGSIINSKPDQSKLKQLRSYLLIACIGEFFLYCLWYVLLAIRAIRTFLAYGMWSGPSNAILFMAILVPILYTASIIQLVSRTKASSPTKKWIGTLIVLNLASCPFISVIHLLEHIMGFYTIPYYIGLTYLCFLNLNLLSVIPIIVASKYGVNRFTRVMWIFLTVISLSPINYLTYLIMKNLDSTQAINTSNATTKTSFDTKSTFSLSPLKKYIIILLHTAIILMVWVVPCAYHRLLDYNGLSRGDSMSLVSAIVDFASYDSLKAASLLVLLILVHIFAVLFLIFTCIGKFKIPIVLFSSGTLGFTCLLHIIAAAYKTVEFPFPGGLIDDAKCIYSFDDVYITIIFALFVLAISLIMLYHRFDEEPKVASAEASFPVQAARPESIPISHDTPKERLTQLNQLRESGLITEEEYNEKKQSILSEL